MRNAKPEDLEGKAAARPHLAVRGLYGGVPTALLQTGGTLAGYGINAIWIGSTALTQASIDVLREHKAQVYAEFNTMHHAPFLADHPDAAPIGTDGRICPPPSGWQGVCPTHPAYRRNRMDAFRATLADFAIDGIWLDYHHSHASWERATPELPDTCFCARCLARFQQETGVRLPEGPTPAQAERLLGALRPRWTAWRCALFTDWVREFRQIRDATRPAALLGTFHCPWNDTEHNGALRHKLAVDLRAQHPHIDVFSTMPYHARFGHADDVEWIARQTNWLGRFLNISGREPGGAVARGPKRIWPIVQLGDWGEPPVPLAQVVPTLAAGTRLPATGVTVFNWGALKAQTEKVDALAAFYRAAAASGAD